MKKVALVSLLLIYSSILLSQKNAQFGFSLGGNYSVVYPKLGEIDRSQSYLQPVHETSNGIGFNLGLSYETRLSSAILFSPRLDLSFNGGEIFTLFPDNSQELTNVSGTTIEARPLFVIRPETNSIMPYFLFGPNMRVPLVKKGSSIQAKPELAIDFGIGLNNKLSNFDFAPELVYSYGVSNIAYQASVDKLYFHKISLIFNFRG